MTSYLHDQIQDAWDKRCRDKNLCPRRGVETRYTEDGTCYHFASGFGRVIFHVHLGWIIVLSYWGLNLDDVYQYISCDKTRWDELEIAINAPDTEPQP